MMSLLLYNILRYFLEHLQLLLHKNRTLLKTIYWICLLHNILQRCSEHVLKHLAFCSNYAEDFLKIFIFIMDTCQILDFIKEQQSLRVICI